MTGRLRLAMLLAALTGSTAQAAAGDTLPPDVTAYLARQAACDHWAGEDPYDAARAQEIAAAVKRLDCEGLEDEAAPLRQRYGADPAVRKALAAAQDP